MVIGWVRKEALRHACRFRLMRLLALQFKTLWTHTTHKMWYMYNKPFSALCCHWSKASLFSPCLLPFLFWVAYKGLPCKARTKMSSTASRVRAANFCCFFCSRTRTELDSQMGLAWSAGPYSHPNEAIRKKVLMAFMPRRRGREKERSDCMECVICQGFFAPRPSCVLAPCFLRWWAAFLCRSVQHTSELIRISPSYGATRQQFFVIENVLHSRW